MVPAARVPALVLAAALGAGLAGCGGDQSAPDASDQPRAEGFTDQPCADLVIVGVRGQQQLAGRNFGVGTEVRLVAEALTAQVQQADDTTVRLESVDYRSDSPAALEEYRGAVQDGAAALGRRLDQLEQTCPDSGLAVIGFSMGAHVVHQALADRPRGTIDVVAMIADPVRSPVAAHDQETFGSYAPNPGSLGPGPELPDELSARAIAFCASGDDVCNHTAGRPRTASDAVHKHAYEDPEVVRTMAARMVQILQRD